MGTLNDNDMFCNIWSFKYTLNNNNGQWEGVAKFTETLQMHQCECKNGWYNKCLSSIEDHNITIIQTRNVIILIIIKYPNRWDIYVHNEITQWNLQMMNK